MRVSPTRFVSLNGPDNSGKSTQVRLLSEARPNIQVLGSVHQHAPHLWRALPADSSTWWFETSSTSELSQLLLESHELRVRARAADRVGLLDRGYPMLIATAIATCVVKDKLAIDDAHAAIEQIQGSHPAPPREFAVLLLISRDAQRNTAVAQMRDPNPWTARYLHYQQVLHAVLMQQVEHRVYDHVIERELQPPAEILRTLVAVVDRTLEHES
jgi:hypothetical protein